MRPAPSPAELADMMDRFNRDPWRPSYCAVLRLDDGEFEITMDDDPEAEPMLVHWVYDFFGNATQFVAFNHADPDDWLVWRRGGNPVAGHDVILHAERTGTPARVVADPRACWDYGMCVAILDWRCDLKRWFRATPVQFDSEELEHRYARAWRNGFRRTRPNIARP